jgi:hypothetical protein
VSLSRLLSYGENEEDDDEDEVDDDEEKDDGGVFELTLLFELLLLANFLWLFESELLALSEFISSLIFSF